MLRGRTIIIDGNTKRREVGMASLNMSGPYKLDKQTIDQCAGVYHCVLTFDVLPPVTQFG